MRVVVRLAMLRAVIRSGPAVSIPVISLAWLMIARPGMRTDHAAEANAMSPTSPPEGDALHICRNGHCEKSVRGEGVSAATARGLPVMPGTWPRSR